MTDAVLPPDADQIRHLAAAALDRLPDPFGAHARAVTILVEDFPADDLLKSMRIDNGWDLTGLYRGVPLTEKSVSDTPAEPDMIHLFRLPILFEWIDRGDIPLADLVAHVLVHELAHHFGWSDDDIAAVDRWWE